MSSETKAVFIPSILKKVIMALTGLVWVGYVAGHMAGNLQFFGPPEAINNYAFFLHHDVPAAALWGIRIFLLVAFVVHVWMAVLLTLENKRARPEGYDVKKTVQASLGSRTMRFSGALVLLFFVIHILHFTVRGLDPTYSQLQIFKNGIWSQDVYAMMTLGFSSWGMSIFYIVAVGLLCLHLSHGVSSMFQSVGLRNKVWEKRLNQLAVAYGAAIFVGFASIPLAVLAAWHGGLDIGEIQTVKESIETYAGVEGVERIQIQYEGMGDELVLEAAAEVEAHAGHR